MKRYFIEDAKCGVTGGGVACGPIGGSSVASIKFREDDGESKWISLVEVDGFPEAMLSDRDVFDDLIKEDIEDEEFMAYSQEHWIHDFNGIKFGESYYHTFASIFEDNENPAIPLIKYLIVLAQCPRSQEEELIRESQWMKAELKRKRQHHQQAIAAQEVAVNGLEEKIKRFRTQRKEMSDALQRWLFEHFMMRNALGQSQNLLQIFKDTSTPTPPSGSGECCAPKLFQYAFSHHLRPISIAEFWWGQSPVGEIREHLHFYPACRGKCLPILQYMLQGLDIEENHHEKPSQKEPEIEYEDEWLMVVRKPEGVLSVPGKVGEASVWSFVRSHCPEATGPLIVHRLDMATSGLLVIAKESSVHKNLQEQFKNREIQKTYIALLEREADPSFPSCGRIHLPLSAMPTDRPRQKVDFEHGRQAVTDYTFITPDRIQLHPLTGRTHQLRVHCAHPKGIGIPIKGDTLYGTPADRLYLHAETLRFRHPVTQEMMAFTWKADF